MGFQNSLPNIFNRKVHNEKEFFIFFLQNDNFTTRPHQYVDWDSWNVLDLLTAPDWEVYEHW